MSTTTPINLSSAHPALVYSFIKHGQRLSKALTEAKTKEKASVTVDITEISAVISEIWKGRGDTSQLSFQSDKFILKALSEIEVILKEVKRFFPKNEEAEMMMQEIEEEQRKLKENLDERNKDASTSSNNGDETSVYNTTPFPWDDHKHSQLFNHKEAYQKLSEREQKCLSFCCGLLPQQLPQEDTKVSWVEISKRELIHWWIGMDFITEPREGEDVLAKLVAEEFLIKRSSCPAFNRNLKMNFRISSSSRTNSYVIHTNTLSNLEANSLFMRRIKAKGSRRPLYMTNQGNKEPEDGKVASKKGESKVVVAINRRIFKLNDVDFFNKYFSTDNDEGDIALINDEDVKILHLGSWPYDPRSYVIVEDIEALKNFLSRTWKSLTSLSLRGIVGIIELPKSIYKIETLKVLDLKSCPNLETMPQGIKSLKKLTQLDVSECYLLNQIPEGIESLSELRVLKGFIIIEDRKNPNKRHCRFKNLSQLEKLIKLDIHARVRDFPTYEDQKTLTEMQQLKKLKITWVLKTDSETPKDSHGKNGPKNNAVDDAAFSIDTPPLLPPTLEKLELQAATEKSASQLLESINYRSGNCPKKLHITGGGLWKLDPYKYRFLNVETLRLRHLHELHMKWIDCQQVFPKLSHLEVYKCPNLIFFPCDDNGIWDSLEQS